LKYDRFITTGVPAKSFQKATAAPKGMPVAEIFEKIYLG
jgi:hypothetical protein